MYPTNNLGHKKQPGLQYGDYVGPLVLCEVSINQVYEIIKAPKTKSH